MSDQKMKTIGVIGLGSIGLRHARNIQALGHKVVSFDPQLKLSLPEFTQVWPIDWRLIDKMDGVVIASPTSEHRQQIILAPKNVPLFVEKPIGEGYLSLEIAINDQRIAPTMVGNNLRFHSCVQWAKENLPDLGKPLWASFTVSQYTDKPPYLRDGVHLNWGAHEIDLALHLLGPATVTASVGNDSCADICLLHEYGVPSVVHLDYLAKCERRGFCILCEKGNLTVDLRYRRGWIWSDGERDAHFDPLDSWDEDYIKEMQAFIDLIDGKPVPHAATGQDGLHALEIILEAKKMAGLA